MCLCTYTHLRQIKTFCPGNYIVCLCMCVYTSAHQIETFSSGSMHYVCVHTYLHQLKTFSSEKNCICVHRHICLLLSRLFRKITPFSFQTARRVKPAEKKHHIPAHLKDLWKQHLTDCLTGALGTISSVRLSSVLAAVRQTGADRL